MIHLERVNGDTIWDILKLTVADHQKNFVADNDVSIIEAYIAITSNGYAFPFGIFEDETPVGFVMIGYDKDEYWKDAPAIADGNYNLWRLMIDKRSNLRSGLSGPSPAAKRISAGCRMSRKTRSPNRCMPLSDLSRPGTKTGKNRSPS